MHLRGMQQHLNLDVRKPRIEKPLITGERKRSPVIKGLICTTTLSQ